jgi:hypothetical protein
MVPGCVWRPVTSIDWRRVDLVIEGSILLLPRDVPCKGGATARARGANLLMSPVRGLRGHRGSLPLNPTRASAPLGEGTTRRGRWNGRFLLNLIGITAELSHRGVLATHHLELSSAEELCTKFVSE